MPEVSQVVAALRRGEAVVLPTDTVYGLAALPSVPGATAAIFRLKGRDADVPLAVLVASRAQALDLCEPPTARVLALMDRFWPGPLTLVMRRSPAAQAMELGGDPTTIGIRWPAHDLVKAIAEVAGPVATTSANRHGQPTAPTADAAAASLLGEVAVVVDGGQLTATPSTVVDVTVDPPSVLREGALAAAEVLAHRPG